jgi:hypothetical protein
MHQQILNRLIVQQVVGETRAIVKAEYLMDAGVAKIGIHEQNCLRGLHGETRSEIYGSQRLPFSVAWTRDA